MLFRAIIFSLLLIIYLPGAHADSGNDFSFTDLHGEIHHRNDYKGKWILVNYWATWCPPCAEEIPDLDRLYIKHKDKDLVVIGIAIGYKSKLEVDKFVDDMLISYPVTLGTSELIGQIGKSEVLPTTFIYNPEGKLVRINHGIISRDDIEKLISGY